MNVDTLWKALTANNISDSAMDILLETYAPLLNDILTDKYTLLTNAIVRGHQKLALALIKYPAVDKNKYGYGNTPLTTAYKCNAPDIVIALINDNVNIKLVTSASPNDISNIDKRKEICALLESKLKFQPEPKEMVISSTKLVNIVSYFETDIGLLTIVIKAHKDILNDSLADHTNILFWAICKKKTFICKVLIEQGVDINYINSSANNCPLMIAVQQNSWDCAEQLILAGAKTDIKNKFGKIVLDEFTDCKPSSDTRLERIRQLLESKMIKPDEKLVETKPVEPSVETPVPKLSVAFQLIQFMRENNLDYSFGNNQITTAPNSKLVEFAIGNNIAFTETATHITIAL